MTDKPWLNASLSVPGRVALLLAAMSIDEKVAQLGYGFSGTCEDINVTIYPNGVGGCQVGAAQAGVEAISALRRALISGTRLGIPPSAYGETTHSGGAGGTTVFPMPCSQGASWNLTLVKEIGRVNALQLRAAGGDHALSPILQVCTDPRFGRLEENFAEDPMLVAAYGVAATAGLQGHDGLEGASTYLGSPRVRERRRRTKAAARLLRFASASFLPPPASPFASRLASPSLRVGCIISGARGRPDCF